MVPSQTQGSAMELADRYIGCLLGTAIGDSLLLPAEGLSRARIGRRFSSPLRHHFICGFGMVSDDTEHAFLTSQALLASGGDVERFARGLASRLRWWLICVPGGCGMATARGLIRSWLGFSPARSGVNSAGNGPAMRASIIGVHCADSPSRLRSFVTASTLITHTDERALTSALAVATAAAHIIRDDPPEDLWSSWRSLSPDPSWHDIIEILERRLNLGSSVDEVAVDLGCPNYVSGFCYHSVPLALYAWLHHPHDSTACLGAILRCGGDTDTAGAIAGSLVGISGGQNAFPSDWIDHIIDWPLSSRILQSAGRALASGKGKPVGWWWAFQPIRNLLFLLIIMLHMVRRLWP